MFDVTVALACHSADKEALLAIRSVLRHGELCTLTRGFLEALSSHGIPASPDVQGNKEAFAI